MVRITNVDGKHSAIVNTLANYESTAASASHLVFDQYGDEYFLAQIWSGGEDVSRNLKPSKRAVQLAQSGAAMQATLLRAATSGR